MRKLYSLIAALLLVALALVAGCGMAAVEQPADGGEAEGASSHRVLYISGIPDQDTATLVRAFESYAHYLSEQTGLDVRYAPATDYAAIVAAFRRGDVHLVWYGGLTGVQAREAVPGAQAIAHRPRDAEFHSRFIVQADLPVQSLEDLIGLTFTFGSESSTSGHLMPRYFLLEAGVDPQSDFRGQPNYSGSHDATWKLVEAGAFQAGALNEAVWEAAVAAGSVDLLRVRDFYTTPAYFDYNWTVHPDVEGLFGEGTSEKLKQALLDMGPEQQELLDLFGTDRFVETSNENYERVREVAEQLGILRPAQ